MLYLLGLIGGLLALATLFQLYDRVVGRKKTLKKLKRQYGLPPIPGKHIEFDSIELYWEERCKAETLVGQIDDLTWGDLDMDDVFRRINVCQTSVGEEYLYSALHEEEFDLDVLAKREKLISFFEEHPTERQEVQCFLAQMGKSDYNGVSNFLYHSDVHRLAHGELVKILPFVPLFFLLFMLVNPGIGLIGLMLSIPVNMTLYYIFKHKVEHELTTVRYISGMLGCCAKLLHWKSDALKEYREKLQEDYAYFRFFRNFGQASRVSTTEADFLADYANMLLFSDLRKYQDLLDAVKKHRLAFRELYRMLGELDMAICIASFRESLVQFCLPTFEERTELSFRKLAHPLLKEAVTNTGVLHSSIVTGSNASGKSTFVKALAVNGILAQTIHTCTAAEFSTRPALVITSMAVRDSISAGDSYFVTEIKSLRRILRKAQETYCVCYVDEILKGTNTIERIAASASVLRCLAGLDCLCITASHDVELTILLADLFENWHFCETIAEKRVEFDFKLKEGPSRTRNAIKLLGQMGFPAEITEHAGEMVEQFTQTGRWALPQNERMQSNGEH